MSDHLIAEANRHAKALSKMTLPTTKPNDRDLDWYVRECESLDERNKVLERENAELRQALADMPTCRCGLSTDEQCALSVENAALRELVGTLGAPNHINVPIEQWRELRADKERLDWLLIKLSQQPAPYEWQLYHWTPEQIRAAIDAARKEAQP